MKNYWVRYNWSDRDFVLKEVKRAGSKLRFADEKFKDDEEIVYAAIKFDGRASRYASERWRNNEEYMLKSISLNSSAFVYVGEKLASNPEFISKVCTFYPKNLVAQNAIRYIEKYNLTMPKEGAQSLVEIANKNKEEIEKLNDAILKTTCEQLKYVILLKYGNQSKSDKERTKFMITTYREKIIDAEHEKMKLENYTPILNKAYSIYGKSCEQEEKELQSQVLANLQEQNS